MIKLSAGLICAAMASAMTAHAADPVSPSCKLLTAGEAADIIGPATTVRDGGAETSGMAICTWDDETAHTELNINTLGPETMSGNSPSAAFDIFKAGYEAKSKIEPIDGIGDKAILADTSADGSIAISIVILKGDHIALLTGTGIKRDKMMVAGTTAAGRM